MNRAKHTAAILTALILFTVSLLSFGCAAAEEKGAMDRKVAGDADILIFPDLHAGNLVYKCMTQVVENMKNGCILTGTKAPVVLTSRADTFETKVNSIALAAIVASELKK